MARLHIRKSQWCPGPIGSLPDKLLARIAGDLLDDPQSYKNLMATCKKMCHITTRTIIEEAHESWADWVPFPFDLELKSTYYGTLPCRAHRRCVGHFLETRARCELHLQTRQAAEDVHRDINPMKYCYYHRLSCLLQAKYITFGSLRFAQRHMEAKHCLAAFDVAPEHKLAALVKLDIYQAIISLDWLDAIIGKLTHLQYLTLDNVTYLRAQDRASESMLANSRCLKVLRIINDYGSNMKDSIFSYFLRNHPAIVLDMTNTLVDVERYVRHYGMSSGYRRVTAAERAFDTLPLERTLSFDMLLSYLQRYSTVVQTFVALDMNVTSTDLERLVKDESLRHLHVHVTHIEESVVGERYLNLSPDEIRRVHQYPYEI